MRRKDREITNLDEIHLIMDECDCCRIGFWDGKEVYVLPMNFGYIRDDEGTTLYFHSAKEGRKIDLIASGTGVGFEMDCGFKLKEAEEACSFSAQFKSIIGNGEISFVDNEDEKELGLQRVMYQCAKKADWTFNKAMFSAVTVFKIKITSMSCKVHN